jgi:GT2 family glycosyltransferase
MNHFWNILMRPIIEAINVNNILEIGTNKVNTRYILDYCNENDANLTVVDKFPIFDVEDFKEEYRNKFEIFKEDTLDELSNLNDYDVVLFNGDHDGSVYNKLKIIEKNSLNKNFPLIFFQDLRLENVQEDAKDKGFESLEEEDQENNKKTSILLIVDNFIAKSDLKFNFEIADCNDTGILYVKDKNVDRIVKNSLDLYNLLESEKNVLIKKLEKYKSEANYLEDCVEEIRNEYEYKSNKYRSFTQRLVSKYPFLQMLLLMPKIGFKNTLINRKGYHAIKNENLLDIGYYLTNNRDVKLSGKDPIIHYIFKGFKEGRKPNSTFDGEYYIETHDDVKNSDLNPLVHYALYGINERRKPNIKKDNLSYNKSSNIVGSIIFKGSNTRITGFLALIGDPSPREAIIKIDNEKFTVKCDELRLDLKEKRINGGSHSFSLTAPPEFMDCKEHTLRLFDKITGELIDTTKTVFTQPRNYRDLSGYLENSLVSPIVYAPFREQDKRCFATMENITSYLINLLEHQDDLPLVSVIMPVYNSIDTLLAAVNSVLRQTYKDIQLIIIDGGSDDGSYEELEKIEDGRVVVIQNLEFKETSKARNLGLTFVKGKYIAYINSNNTWDSRYVAAMVGAFLELPDADAVYSGQLMFAQDQEHPFAVRFGNLNRSLLENRNYIDLNALCHTQNLYKEIGGFDESLNQFSDWDWILKVSNQSQIYSIPVLLCNYQCKINNSENRDSEIRYLELFREKQAERQENDRVNVINNSLPLNNKVSIIIPSYESLEDIQECIQSIFDLNLGELLEIIVVDNASSKPVKDYLSKMVADNKIKFIENNINYGFTYAVNQGISGAETGNDIMLMNNDAMVTPGAIEAMQKAAYELSNCGIVVPQQVLPGGSKTLVDHVPYAYQQFECDVNLSWLFNNSINMPLFHPGKVVELNFAPFFCVYIKRDVFDSSIGLDAEYGRHYRSDRIFCNYIRHVMKLKIYHVLDAVVYHKVQKSTEVLRERSYDDFDTMFTKNQWDDKLASKFGYKKPLWDF